MKTITQWANDPRVPFSKMSIWKAVRDGTLKASRPKKLWLISDSDMMEFLSRGKNG